MAIDKAVDSGQLDSDLTSIANAIRTKGSTSASLTFPAGFISAISNIPSGSSYEKIFEGDYTVSTSSTSAATIDTITPTKTVWEHAHIVYVRIRDKAGRRAGYFYGSDCFFINNNHGGGTVGSVLNGARFIHKTGTSQPVIMNVYGSTTGYGVYMSEFTSAGKVKISSRYNSTYSGTIDGTYHVEVYLLNYPDGVNPFD